MQIYIVSKDYTKRCEVPKTNIHMTQKTQHLSRVIITVLD